MSRNRGTPKPRPISNEELAKKIAGLKSGYESIRQTFIKLFTNAYHQIKDPNEVLIATIFTQVSDSLTTETKELEAHLVETNRFSNDFYLTKLKLAVLMSRYLYVKDDKEECYTQMQGTLIQLIGLLDNKKFSFAHDELFQEEIFFCYQILVQQKDATGQRKTAHYLQLVEFGLSRLAPLFSCNHFKLTFMFNFWTAYNAAGKSLLLEMPLSEKDKFKETHKNAAGALLSRLEKDPDDIYAAAHYCTINYTMTRFLLRTHPRSFLKEKGKVADRTPHVARDDGAILKKRKQHLKFASELMKHYVEPTLKVLLKADPQRVHNNAEPLLLLISILKQIVTLLDDHALNYTRWIYESTFVEDKYKFSLAGLALLRLKIDTLQIQSSYWIGHAHEYLELLRVCIDKQEKQAHSLSESDIAKQKTAAEENAKFRQAWEEREKQLQEKINARESSPEKNPPKKDKNPKKQPDKQQHYFSRAAYFSRNLRHRDASQMYERAYDGAVKSNDLSDRLAALDGQLLTNGQSLRDKLRKLNKKLTSNLGHSKTKRFKPIYAKQLRKYRNEIRIASQELKKLKKLRVLYNAFARQPDVTTNAGIQEGLVVSKQLIADLFNEIHSILPETHQSFSKLRERFQAQSSMQDSAAQKQKTAELESLIDDFQKLQPVVAPRTPKVSLTTSLKEAFSTLEDIPGDHCLVGSNVISLLSDNGNERLDIRDIDFASSCHDDSTLLAKGFTPSIYPPFPYQKNGVDIALAKTKTDNWRKEDAEKRDFTICAVYIDKNGNADDPLGTGIEDIANRRLRMIGDPVKKLKEDPVRLLRAMRYIMDGFTPDQALVNALKSFVLPETFKSQPGDLTDRRQHLYAVAKKYLLRFDRKQFVSELLKYDLLKKLFDISDQKVDVALWKLENIVGMQTPRKAKTAAFFTSANQSVKILSRELPVDFKFAVKKVKV